MQKARGVKSSWCKTFQLKKMFGINVSGWAKLRVAVTLHVPASLYCTAVNRDLVWSHQSGRVGYGHSGQSSARLTSEKKR